MAMVKENNLNFKISMNLTIIKSELRDWGAYQYKISIGCKGAVDAGSRSCRWFFGRSVRHQAELPARLPLL